MEANSGQPFGTHESFHSCGVALILQQMWLCFVEKSWWLHKQVARVSTSGLNRVHESEW